MNILQELAESYKYNGSVSLKAIEDDIVTLQNQIDSYNATLKEVNLRHKNSAPLVAKIREAKIKLTLLKTLLKKETEKGVSNDVIMDMLGVSGKEAKEVETPETAAANKKPKAQNFESSELGYEEKVDYVVDNLSTVPIMENVAREITDQGKLYSVAPEITNAGIIYNVQTEITKEDKETVVDEVKPENTEVSDNKIVTGEAVDDDETVPPPTIDDYEEPVDSQTPKVTIDMETGEVVLNTDCFTNPTDYNIPFNPCYECDLTSCPSHPDSEFVTRICPEPVIKPLEKEIVCEKYATMATSEEQPEETKTAVCDDVELADCLAPEDDKVVDVEYPAVTDMFYESETSIYASYDLHEVTNMVNTNSVAGLWDFRKKTLDIFFEDTRDYEIFASLLKEYNESRLSFTKFLKKPKSIFMTVHQKYGDVVKRYNYEFVGCRVKSFEDGMFLSQRDADRATIFRHDCKVSFKYKRLKIS